MSYFALDRDDAGVREWAVAAIREEPANGKVAVEQSGIAHAEDDVAVAEHLAGPAGHAGVTTMGGNFPRSRAVVASGLQ